MPKLNTTFFKMTDASLRLIETSDITLTDLRVFLRISRECLFGKPTPLTNSEIGAFSKSHQTSVSKSISKLVSLGLIEVTQGGRTRQISLASEPNILGESTNDPLPIDQGTLANTPNTLGKSAKPKASKPAVKAEPRASKIPKIIKTNLDTPKVEKVAQPKVKERKSLEELEREVNEGKLRKDNSYPLNVYYYLYQTFYKEPPPFEKFEQVQTKNIWQANLTHFQNDSEKAARRILIVMREILRVAKEQDKTGPWPFNNGMAEFNLFKIHTHWGAAVKHTLAKYQKDEAEHAAAEQKRLEREAWLREAQRRDAEESAEYERRQKLAEQKRRESAAVVETS